MNKVAKVVFGIGLLMGLAFPLSCTKGTSGNLNKSKDSGINNSNNTYPCSVTCSGCCTFDDTCIKSPNNNACGVKGSICLQCAEDQECSKTGKCVSTGGCGPATCIDGCCQNGNCIQPPSAESCGTGGSQCISCISGQCVNGECTDCEPQCDQKCPGADNECGGICLESEAQCDGCCTEANVCVPGLQPDACGKDGNLCVDCTINTDDRTICAFQECNMPCTGCWRDQQCFAGDQPDACGKDAMNCDNCAEKNQVCSSSRECVESTKPCAGCRSGDQCKEGTADDECGKGGDNCTDCRADKDGNTWCIAQECKAPCKGCLAGGVCQPGDKDDACGSEATTGTRECQTCVNGMQCSDKKCVAPPCDGCLLSNGTCFTGDSIKFCGGDGKKCKACDIETQLCKLPDKTCVDLTSCNGCWQKSECKNKTPPDLNACGIGGEYCKNCTIWTSAEICDISSGNGQCCNADKTVCR